MMDPDASQTATALLTEHLQYTPLSVIDDIINSVNNFIYQGVGSLETGLLSTPPERLGFKGNKDGDDFEYPEAKQEIEEGLHKLETLLNSTVDKNFDKFEIYVLRNIFSLPPDLLNWMRLKHYENVSYPPPADVPSTETIQILRKKLAASRTVSRTLQQEHTRNELLLAQLKNLLGSENQPNLSFLSESGKSHNLNVGSTQGLCSNTTFAVSQLPALKSLLADLRPKLATMKETNLSINTAKDELRQERRQYIEQRTRSHIERNGQEIDDILPGKKVEPSERHAIEKLAATFDSS